jgi:hypothetical protein
MKSIAVSLISLVAVSSFLIIATAALAQQAAEKQAASEPAALPQPPVDKPATEKQAAPQGGAQQPGSMFPMMPAVKPARPQAELDAELSKSLSGATLEGSFNFTGAGRDATRVSADKYTLGEVKKLTGNIWTFQYNFRGTVIPLPVPILWAGETPIVTIDNFSIMGMGPYTARVMFFEDHYSGYWKHGDRGGNMFGVIHRAKPADGAAGAPAKPMGDAAPATENAPASDPAKK